VSGAPLFPVFLKLAGKPVTVVGAGPVAASKLAALLEAGAIVTVVAPDVHPDIAALPVRLVQRAFEPSDLDGAWYVVAAAPPEVNRAVAAAGDARRLFVNAVDDPSNASVYLGGIVRRDEVTVAISTGGRAPALAGLLREAFDRLLPRELDRWLAVNDVERARWKRDGVPMERRRPQLLDALNAIYAKDQDGQSSDGPSDANASLPLVALVGAGPGDPDLLTRRAVARLAAADFVLYDALTRPEALALAPHARKISVGKRHGRHSVSQDTINKLLVRGARRGKRVVRLKCGDPFVFGRGGEEAVALAQAGVPFEIVPGVSSAVAAPALAGIPVTHRGLASGFVVLSGHAEAAWTPIVEGLTPRSVTLVVLMGISTRHRLASRLIERGWPSSTPAALLFSAATPDASTWIGTLAELADAQRSPVDEHDHGPGTIVVGDVVGLAALLGGQASAPDGGAEAAPCGEQEERAAGSGRV
jgi:uroporphyrin-III C-methyltransferase/precorrin-2 dehydrogenase/sirohydrochlorin ferrochelatase